MEEGSNIVGSNRLTLWGTSIKNKANKQKLKKRQQFEEGGTSPPPAKTRINTDNQQNPYLIRFNKDDCYDPNSLSVKLVTEEGAVVGESLYPSPV